MVSDAAATKAPIARIADKAAGVFVPAVIAIAAVFLGVAVCKTGIECVLYDIPLLVKFPKNAIAFVADAIPMVIGYVLAITTLKKPIALFNQE
jgi:cation transport ATPase